MNINFTPFSGSPKSHSDITHVEKNDTTDAVSETSSEDTSESFLSKLTALFGGKTTEESQEGTAKAVDGANAVEEETDAGDVQLKGVRISSDVSDTDVSDTDVSDTESLDAIVADVKAVSADTSVASVAQSNGKVSDAGDDTHSKENGKDVATQIVGEGQAVLSRLKSASQQLTQKDGKDLPAPKTGKGQEQELQLSADDIADLSAKTEMMAQSSDPLSNLSAEQSISPESSESVRKDKKPSLSQHHLTTVSGDKSSGTRLTAADYLKLADQEAGKTESVQASTSTSAVDKQNGSEQTDVSSHRHHFNPSVKPDVRALNHSLSGPVHTSVHASTTQNDAAMTALTTQTPTGLLQGQDASVVQTQSTPLSSSLSAVNSSGQWTEKQMLNAFDDKKHRLGSESLTTNQGSPDSVARQLSSLMGHQSSATGVGQVRAEPAQSPPVYVTRDVAADQLSERIHMMMSKNLKNIDIRLDPPELGRMNIRMHMSGDQATVHFTVANPQVRDVIEHSMSRLRDMLTQQGVQLGETTVQHQGANQQQGYASSGQKTSLSHGAHQIKDSGFTEDNPDTGVKLGLNVTTKRDGISYYA